MINTEFGPFKFGVAQISFPVKLSEKIVESNVKKIAVGGTVPEQCDDGVEPAPGPDNPEADSGFLCVYLGLAKFGTPSFLSVSNPVTGSGGASQQGATVQLASTELPDVVSGSWAVTG
jgi:hypothetical protein